MKAARILIIIASIWQTIVGAVMCVTTALRSPGGILVYLIPMAILIAGIAGALSMRRSAMADPDRARKSRRSVVGINLIVAVLMGFLLHVIVAISAQNGTAMGPAFAVGIVVGMIVLIAPVAIIVLCLHLPVWTADSKGVSGGLLVKITASSLVLLASIAIPATSAGSKITNQTPAFLSNALPSTPGGIYTSEEFNYKLVTPGKPWVQLEAQSFNPEANLVLMRSNPQLMFTVIAETMQPTDTFGTEQLAEIAKANLLSVASSATFHNETTRVIDGMTGIQYEAEVLVEGERLYYMFWIGSRNGFFYQLIVFSEIKNKTATQFQSPGMFARFSQIDPAREGIGSEGEPAGVLRSDIHGYEIDLAGTEWQIWQTMYEDSDTEIGAFLPLDSYVGVMPLDLRGTNPTLPELARAMMANIDVVYPGPTVTNIKPIEYQGLKGLSFMVEKETEGQPLTMYCRLFANENHAFLALAWSSDSLGNASRAQMNDVLDRIKIDEPAAPSRKPFSLSQQHRSVQSLVFSFLSDYAYEAMQYPRAAAYAKASFALDDSQLERLFDVVVSLSNAGKNQEALTFLNEHSNPFPDSPQVIATRAWLLAETGRHDEGLQLFEELFTSGFIDDGYLALYSELVDTPRRAESAEPVFADYRKIADSPSATFGHASALVTLDRAGEAIDLLQSGIDIWGDSPQLMIALMDAFSAASRYNELIQCCESAIANGFDSSYVRVAQGSAEFELGWYSKAKSSFEAAIELDPSDASARSYLDYVSAALGEGANSDLKSPIEPVALPTSLAESIPAFESTEDAYYADRSLGYLFKSGEIFKSTERVLVQVQGWAGADQFGSFQFPFDPIAERMFVNRLEVRDDDGTIISTGKVEDYYVIDDVADGIASQDKLLEIPVAGIRPGVTIELEVSREYKAAPETFPFKERMLGSTIPMARTAVYVRGDIDRVIAVASDTVIATESDDCLIWRTEEPTPFQWEPFQPSWFEVIPTVRLADNTNDWATLGRDYLSDIKESLAPAPEAKALLPTIDTPQASTADRIRAIAEYVQREYTYQAVAFGQRAYIPEPTADVIERKHGDCKDHAMLLYQLLRAAQIDASLALVRIESPVVADIPSIDQFDHMIVHVPDLGPNAFIDCTDKETDVLLPAPIGLGGTHALVLSQDEPTLVAIADYPAHLSKVLLESQITVAKTGHVAVTDRLELQGYTAAYFRYLFRGETEDNRRALLQSQINASGARARVKSVELESLEDTSRPLVLLAQYDIPNTFKLINDQLVGSVPAHWAREYLSVVFVDDRQSPFYVPFPITMETNITVLAPQASEPAHEAPISMDKSNEFATWSFSLEPHDAAFKFSFKAQRAGGHFPASEYTPFCETLDAFFKSIDTPLIFTAPPDR